MKKIFFTIVFTSTVLVSSLSAFMLDERIEACDKGDILSCTTVGMDYLDGKGVKQDYKLAYEFFVKSCDGNNALGCYYQGLMFARGLGQPVNFDKAIEHMTLSCNKGGSLACEYLSFLEKIDQEKLETNVKLTKKLLKNSIKECENKQNFYCYQVGNTYYKGYDVPQDYNKAAEYYMKSCDIGGYGNGMGCTKLGSMYASGKGFASNNVKAKFYHEKACDLLDGSACNTIGANYKFGIYGYAKNYIKSMEYYTKACNNYFYRGCRNIGKLYEDGNGVRQDNVKALEFYGKACDKQDMIGCKDYARLNKQIND